MTAWSSDAPAVNDVVNDVVVGVDESPTAAHALEWTAKVLAPSATIHAVNAVSPAVELAVAAVQYNSAPLVERRRHELESEWSAPARAAGATVVCHVIEDTAPRALLRVADQTAAEMIVVGTKGQVHRVPRLLGSCVRELLAQSPRPVVVVPDGAELAPTGSVVVDVDHDEHVDEALRWAAQFAAARGLALNLVRAGPPWRLFSLDGLVERLAYCIDPGVVRTWALEDLAELAEQIRYSTDEELEIAWSVHKDTRHPRIVETTGDTALLVLDAHADDRSGGESWIHDRIKHAPCPTVVFGTPLNPLVGFPPLPG
jgi:nucleotide-binding universal stress UspA family protein